MKTLGGWWRLWISISVLWVVFALPAAWPRQEQRGYDAFPGSQATARLAALIRSAPSGCIASTIETTTAQIDDPDNANSTVPYMEARLSCRPEAGIWFLLLFVIVPPLILAALGYAVRWIAHGFRPRETAHLK